MTAASDRATPGPTLLADKSTLSNAVTMQYTVGAAASGAVIEALSSADSASSLTQSYTALDWLLGTVSSALGRLHDDVDVVKHTS